MNLIKRKGKPLSSNGAMQIKDIKDLTGTSNSFVYSVYS